MLREGGTALSKLEADLREFQGRHDRRVDPKRLRAVIDALECELAVEVKDAQQSGDYLVDGAPSVVSWISRTCGMSVGDIGSGPALRWHPTRVTAQGRSRVELRRNRLPIRLSPVSPA